MSARSMIALPPPTGSAIRLYFAVASGAGPSWVTWIRYSPSLSAVRSNVEVNSFGSPPACVVWSTLP